MAVKKIIIEYDNDFKTHFEGIDNMLEVLGMLRFAESQIIESINASFEIDEERRATC